MDDAYLSKAEALLQIVETLNDLPLSVEVSRVDLHRSSQGAWWWSVSAGQYRKPNTETVEALRLGFWRRLVEANSNYPDDGFYQVSLWQVQQAAENSSPS